jgi:hypothetical protein
LAKGSLSCWNGKVLPRRFLVSLIDMLDRILQSDSAKWPQTMNHRSLIYAFYCQEIEYPSKRRFC